MGGLESIDYAEEKKPRQQLYAPSKSNSSDLIASYSASTEKTSIITLPTATVNKNTSHDQSLDAIHTPLVESHGGDELRNSPGMRLEREERPATVSKPRNSPGKMLEREGRPVAVSVDRNGTEKSTSRYGEEKHSSGNGKVLVSRSPRGNEASRHLRKQTSSTENLLSSSRDDVTADSHSQASQNGLGAARSNGRVAEGLEANYELAGHEESSRGASGAKQRQSSLISRDPSMEDILQKLLKEKAEVPMNFPREQVSKYTYILMCA